MKKKLVIWGTSGHALVVVDAVRVQGVYEIVGFLDDFNPERHGKLFCGVPILGDRNQIPILKARGGISAVLAFGNCEARLELSRQLAKDGLELATVIHPKATVAKDTSIGGGTVVLAGAVINVGASIGKSVIVNTSASVDHECVIEDAVHICPGVHLAGKVKVGEAAWVGIGSSVVDGISIGKRCVIGAGSVVIKDIPDGVVAYGVPARIVRKDVHK
jgi:acetyltransferase EpsM